MLKEPTERQVRAIGTDEDADNFEYSWAGNDAEPCARGAESGATYNSLTMVEQD